MALRKDPDAIKYIPKEKHNIYCSQSIKNESYREK